MDIKDTHILNQDIIQSAPTTEPARQELLDECS